MENGILGIEANENPAVYVWPYLKISRYKDRTPNVCVYDCVLPHLLIEHLIVLVYRIYRYERPVPVAHVPTYVLAGIVENEAVRHLTEDDHEYRPAGAVREGRN